ncbi:MAG: protein phosphatase 2C domain-containing protein [Anaerolineae bacterium]|jgi:protein phosphatase
MRFLRWLKKPESPVAPPQEERDAVEKERTAARVRIGWSTDVGLVRGQNEDALLILESYQEGDQPLPPFGFFAVADGMGGHQSGEIASSLAVRSATGYIVREIYQYTLSDAEPSSARLSLLEALVGAVNQANADVASTVPGGGTTLTCALVIGRRVYIAHVGDSRAYLAFDGRLEQLTQDHSLVDRLMTLGELTEEEAANHPQKNVLYRAVGQSGGLEVDTYFRSLPEGARLLICTDGLWGLLGDEHMAEIISTAESPQDACDALVVSANEAGGRDNITAVLVELPPA